MKFLFLAATTLWASTQITPAMQGKAEIISSEISYTVKYLIKTAVGTSTKAKGKGECQGMSCDFLVAVPINSFQSGDGNRDQNMLVTAKADKNPLAIVKFHTGSDLPLKTARAEVSFAGKTAVYENIEFTMSNPKEASGTIMLDLKKHDVEIPSLMGKEIDNPITIHFKGSIIFN